MRNQAIIFTLLCVSSLSMADDPFNFPRIDKPKRMLAKSHDPILTGINDVFDHLVGEWFGGGLFQLFRPPTFQTNLT